MRKKLLPTLLLSLWAFSLAQCGDGDSLSSKVKFEPIPEDPVVILADFTGVDDDGEEYTVEAPWFVYRSRITNNSDKKLYVVTTRFTGTAYKSGQANEMDISIDTGEFCDGRGYLAILDPTEVYQGVTSCNPDAPITTSFEEILIYGLPDNDSTVYPIQVEAIGWFVDSSEIPIQRFSSYGFILTQ